MAKSSKIRKTMRTTSTSMTETKQKEVPKGAKIVDKTVRTEIEEVENGWLISKNYDITYEQGKERGYAYYSKKWYSKEDPLEIKLKDESLADVFEDDETD